MIIPKFNSTQSMMRTTSLVMGSPQKKVFEKLTNPQFNQVRYQAPKMGFVP